MPLILNPYIDRPTGVSNERVHPVTLKRTPVSKRPFSNVRSQVKQFEGNQYFLLDLGGHIDVMFIQIN